MIRWSTAGSVDDGKSTLIGRLLKDSHALLDDQLEALVAASGDQPLDLAWVTDGLQAEREQRITIDVAYRYFETSRRKFILADTPGHEQFTRNMLTGISQVELVVVLVDARKGMTEQTRRHLLLCSLVNIPHIVLAINKMDAVDFAEAVYLQIHQTFQDYCARLQPATRVAMPLSALLGDNVVERSTRMPWYTGPTLLQHLENVEPSSSLNHRDFRLFVQGVLRPHQDFRGFMGTVGSGRIAAGQEVRLWPGGAKNRVLGLFDGDGPVSEAAAGQPVVLTLENEMEAGRGMLVTRSRNEPEASADLDVTLFWMSSVAMTLPGRYLIQQGTRRVRVQIAEILYQLQSENLHQRPSERLEMNEFGRVHLQAFETIYFDRYENNRCTGSFLLIDIDTHETVAAGMIRGSFSSSQGPEVFPQGLEVTRAEHESARAHRAGILWITAPPASGKTSLANGLVREFFRRGFHFLSLDGDDLRHTVNMDLDFSPAGRTENIRRAAAIAQLAYNQGQLVVCSFVSPYRQDRGLARALFPPGHFVEVYLECDLETRQSRDRKNLYARASKGEIPHFTDIYEPPIAPEIHLDSTLLSSSECAAQVMKYLVEQGWLRNL